MDVRVGLERKLSTEELMLLNCGVRGKRWVAWLGGGVGMLAVVSAGEAGGGEFFLRWCKVYPLRGSGGKRAGKLHPYPGKTGINSPGFPFSLENTGEN